MWENQCSIKRRKFSAEDTLHEFVARKHLPRAFEKTCAINQILQTSGSQLTGFSDNMPAKSSSKSPDLIFGG